MMKDNINVVEDFFKYGYVEHDYDKVMALVADDYLIIVLQVQEVIVMLWQY